MRRVTNAAGYLTRASVYQPYGTQVETVRLAPPAESKGYVGERVQGVAKEVLKTPHRTPAAKFGG